MDNPTGRNPDPTMKARTKIGLKEVYQGLAGTLVCLAILEGMLRIAYFARNSMVDYVPLPYADGDEYGPVPPWLDGLRILERDRALIWKNRPSLRRRYVDVFSPVDTEQDRVSFLRQFFPRLPASLKNNPVWEISLNSDGFRDEDFPKRKSPAAFRIICLGDSWTFGANVGQEEAYPQRLKALLRQEFPKANFEVFNLGVLGYSSYQGLELVRKTAIKMQPDMLTIAYAWNDDSQAGFHDKEMANYKTSSTEKLVASLSESSESYKFMRSLALVLKYKPRSIGERLQAAAGSAQQAEEGTDYDKLEPWIRVPIREYEKNILEMIELARSHGAEVILLDNELFKQGRYRAALERISKAKRAPLLNSSGLVAEARRRIEEDVERKLDLRPAKEAGVSRKDEIEVVFRVYLGNRAVPKAMYIVGNDPKLGNLVPNKIVMYDDGTHGDQRAEDHVWSYSATFPPGTQLFYVYTNSGEEGKWEGLDVPGVRSFKVDANKELK